MRRTAPVHHYGTRAVAQNNINIYSVTVVEVGLVDYSSFEYLNIRVRRKTAYCVCVQLYYKKKIVYFTVHYKL